MSLEVKNAHRQAFKEIFSMKAVEGKLDKKGLADLFIMIDYKIPQEQFDEMVQRIFGKKEQIGFEEFLKIFNLKLTDYTFNDVRNAFKLLAKDDDRHNYTLINIQVHSLREDQEGVTKEQCTC
ncbi:unnamed protein product [Paramecium octaurelia]|uniref:Uncharacterized protein n=1 Tax=Paramecium octaurelia TaxID=43137 RepID=A0A8S1SZB3_PAROT|nr:unnamed protein product [Paramecium octaurelia]